MRILQQFRENLLALSPKQLRLSFQRHRRSARTVLSPSSGEYHCGGGSRRINS